MASATHADGGKKNTNQGGTTSYDDFIELRKRIILKEKELLEKKKKKRAEEASVKNGGEEIAVKEEVEGQKGKVVMYRSFDEFYKYKKNFEDHEVKVKRDAMKSLSKCSASGASYVGGSSDATGGNDASGPNDVHAANNVHAANERGERGDRGDHRYSYIKLKTERQGTVKQLKEYFQKMQEDQIQKRNNEMLQKRDKKGATSASDKGNERGLNSGNTVLGRMENEKRCYSPEDDLPTTLHPCAGAVDTRDNRANSQSDHMDTKELELLCNLISEMKKSCDNGEDYIAHLVQDLHKSNKRHLVQKILQILKTVDNKITSEQGKKPLEPGESKVGEGDTRKKNPNVNTSINMVSDKRVGNADKALPDKQNTNGGHPKVLPKNTLNSSSLHKNEKEKKNAPVRSGSPIHVKIKKYNDAVQAGYSQMGRPPYAKGEVGKADGSLTRTTDPTKDPTKGEKGMDKEKSGKKGALQDGKSNQTSTTSSDETNSQSKRPHDNASSLPPNGNTAKSETNEAGKFEWFYATMKDLYSEDDEEVGEPNDGPSGKPNYYSSEGSENDDLFTWLQNRDVEKVLSGKKRSDEGETSEESGLVPVP
ncbi:hypothetical protein AK88_04028 [Plasmodium fragile]|uniref:Uncharacterized protein n=1 Tax=Plasmodium fragile TaxID=5857 RepID=A0A0D9QH17_PLAFR|nr:uncharacterized protein AK88_04028 [Plasmodium fragile]KJP86309.1 hypothetical protein AK88_04028 [Plasmodium fragile]